VRAWRLLALLPALLPALLLAACGGAKTHPPRLVSGSGAGAPAGDWSDDLSRSQGARYRNARDSVPPPIDVSRIPEPVPKPEPRSLYGNKSPYSVLGKTYRVLPSAGGYRERGIASFYGEKFHGYKTSNLETYDMYAFTAASTVLPLPSFARVTNLENGKSVVVRVNDRGPFHEGRVIDLSYAAAIRIGIWPKGTGLVEVRGIDPGAPARELPPPKPVPVGQADIYLQVGAYADRDNAERVAKTLRQARLGRVTITKAKVGADKVHRVRVGPFANADASDAASARIQALGLGTPRVAVD